VVSTVTSPVGEIVIPGAGASSSSTSSLDESSPAAPAPSTYCTSALSAPPTGERSSLTKSRRGAMQSSTSRSEFSWPPTYLVYGFFGSSSHSWPPPGALMTIL
jgi:hypothetical protein